MAIDYGVTPQGFVKKSLSVIKAEREDKLRSDLGSEINLLPGTVFATIVGIESEREAELWDLAEDTYNAHYPDTADGANLDNAMGITGAKRLGARKSRQTQQLFYGDTGTVVPKDFIVRVLNNAAARYLLDADVVLVDGVDEVQEIEFSAVPASGDWSLEFDGEITSSLAFNASAAAVQAALRALNGLSEVTVTGDYAAGFVVTFTGLDGKRPQALITVESNTLNGSITITLARVTLGVAQGVGNLTAEVTGAIPGGKGTITEIITPVSGLTRTLNAIDSDVGRSVETDAAARIRRANSLQSAGAGTVEAIKTGLETVENVTKAIVFENDTHLPFNGIPPNSIHAFVEGGEDQDIWDKLWQVKGGGIRAFGDEIGYVVDSQGLTRTVAFSRPILVPIFINIEVTKDAALFPANGENLIRQALADFINTLGIGEDVIVFPRLICVLDAIPGIVDIEVGINTTGAPALGDDDNIMVDINEVARVDDQSTDIVVAVV